MYFKTLTRLRFPNVSLIKRTGGSQITCFCSLGPPRELLHLQEGSGSPQKATIPKGATQTRPDPTRGPPTKPTSEGTKVVQLLEKFRGVPMWGGKHVPPGHRCCLISKTMACETEVSPWAWFRGLWGKLTLGSGGICRHEWRSGDCKKWLRIHLVCSSYFRAPKRCEREWRLGGPRVEEEMPERGAQHSYFGLKNCSKDCRKKHFSDKKGSHPICPDIFF